MFDGSLRTEWGDHVANAPTKSVTWHADANNSVAQQADALATNRKLLRELWTIALINAGCTVRYSCDSVTAGTPGDGVNRWDADTDLVYSDFAAHSWMVLRLPTGLNSCEILINLESSATGSGFSIYMSAVGFTGGAVDARPTASDEWEITVGTSTGLETSNGSYVWHIVWSEDGTSIRLFVWRTTTLPIVMLFERVQQSPVAWAIPIASVYRFVTGGGAATYTNWIGSTSLRGRHAGAQYDMQLNSYTARDGANLDGKIPLYPVHVRNTTNGDLGVLRDFYIAASSIADKTTFPSGSTRQWMTFEDFVIPWDGTDLSGSSSNAKLVNEEYSTLVSITSNSGITRWTPIVIRTQIPSGLAMYVILKIGNNRFEIYDIDDEWLAMFADRSSIAVDGADTVITVLPNGGWWSDEFEISVILGREVVQ